MCGGRRRRELDPSPVAAAPPRGFCRHLRPELTRPLGSACWGCAVAVAAAPTTISVKSAGGLHGETVEPCTGRAPGLIVRQMEIPLELIQRLPKTDLHCHLDGSLRLDTVLDLAKQQGVKLPTVRSRRAVPHALRGRSRRRRSTTTCGVRHHAVGACRPRRRSSACAYELAEDAWRENVRYLEVRYSPLLHTRAGLRPAQVVEAVLRGLRTAKRELGIRYGVILCAIRSLGPESSRCASPSCASRSRTAASSASISRAARSTTRPSCTARRSSSSSTTTSTAPRTPASRSARTRCTRRSTSAARTASATARAWSRAATCSTTSTTTASRSRCARRRTSRRARPRAGRRTRSTSSSTTACASRSTPTTA